MSAEPWRRSGTPVAPRLFVWQAWYFGGLRLDLLDVRGTLATKRDPCGAAAFLRLDLRGRCGSFETLVDVRGTLATKRDPCRY